MKIQIKFILFASVLICSCSHFYRITTTTDQAHDYNILAASDSNITVISRDYRSELTPEVIREYQKVIPSGSITKLAKESTTGSDILAGWLTSNIGSGIGYAIGYAAAPRDQIYILTAPAAAIPAAIIGVLLNEKEDNMLPLHEHLSELQKEK